ncbi:MAG: M48 family metallopeptidase [Lentisphaeria bacterium]
MSELLIELKQGNLICIVKRNARSKRLIMRLRDGKVQVTAPLKCSIKVVREFVEQHKDYLENALEKHNKEKDKFYLQTPKRIQPGTMVPFLGEMVEVKVGVMGWDRQSNVISLPFIKDRFEELNIFYVRHLEKVIGELGNVYEKLLSVKVNRYTIRAQRQRWGSCSSLGNINFNWRLILLPFDVLEMIFAHELCHLRYMNHSTDFYQLLYNVYPNAKEADEWLREYGMVILALFT